MIWLIAFFLILIWSCGQAKAVMPPDFIFNVGTQIVQAFSVIMLFFTFALTISYQFIKNWLNAIKGKKLFWLISIVSVIIISLALAFYYGDFRQNQEYQQWLADSLKFGQKTAGLDQLQIGQVGKLDNSNQKFVDLINKDLADENTVFIKKYYSFIANGQLDEAYDISKKGVDTNTFKSWYTNTTKISLDKLTRIDDKTSSLELTLYEGNIYTRYGVLMSLLIENAHPIRIEKSDARVLSKGSIVNGSGTPQSISNDYAFYNSNKNKKIILTNQELKDALSSKRSDFMVLDARENLEYDNGHLDGSVHIRFADLKSGRWIEVPNDKFIYVLCWSGIRGKEVADFLRSKMIVASYLENGANGWVDSGGAWNGNIKFLDKYTEEKYQLVFETADIRKLVGEGVKLVDCRQPDKFNDWHVPGSVNIPIMYTPTLGMEGVFSQLMPKSRVVTICDDYVNCFDAKITGVELENRGHTFLGRYNKPWEMK